MIRRRSRPAPPPRPGRRSTGGRPWPPAAWPWSRPAARSPPGAPAPRASPDRPVGPGWGPAGRRRPARGRRRSWPEDQPEPVVELALGQPALGQVVAEQLDGLVAFLVPDPHRLPLGHAPSISPDGRSARTARRRVRPGATTVRPLRRVGAHAGRRRRGSRSPEVRRLVGGRCEQHQASGQAHRRHQVARATTSWSSSRRWATPPTT